jgi:hypothetical protein
MRSWYLVIEFSWLNRHGNYFLLEPGTPLGGCLGFLFLEIWLLSGI